MDGIAPLKLFPERSRKDSFVRLTIVPGYLPLEVTYGKISSCQIFQITNFNWYGSREPSFVELQTLDVCSQQEKRVTFQEVLGYQTRFSKLLSSKIF
jgi:hypothetical protein